MFYLQTQGTIGDREDADLRLPGVAPMQAVIRRDDRDEYVIEADPEGVPIRVHGSRMLRPTQLRTGARIEMGAWRMVYFRRSRRPRSPVRGRRAARSNSSSGSRPAATARRSWGDPGGRAGRAAVSPRQPTVWISGESTATGSGVRPARSIRHQETKPITQKTP